jgi:hypothetical protein
VTAAVPVFFTVMDWDGAVAPTVVEGNVRLVGVKLSVAVELVVGHALTTLATFIVPRPVARSYPAPPENPSMMPSGSPFVFVTQSMAPVTHTCALEPVVMSWK